MAWILLLRRAGGALLETWPSIANIASIIVAAVEAAERVPGLRDGAKKEHALRFVAAAIAAINRAAGEEVIDPATAYATAGDAIDLLVYTINVWHKAPAGSPAVEREHGR